MSTAADGGAIQSGELAIDSVTGVAVSLPLAGAGGRSYAFIIDWHIRLLLAMAWWVVGTFVFTGGFTLFGDGVVGGEGNSGDGAGPGPYFFTVVFPALLIYFLYHPVLEIAMHGRTPGKRIAGVRIVTREGATPGVGALLIRNVFRLIDSLPVFYCLGLAVTLSTAQHVRIGDLAAGTLLVYDRGGSLPSSVAGLAQGALDPRLAEIVDELLARWNELAPEARRPLAQKILQRVDADAAEIEDLNDADLLARLRALLQARAG